MYFYKYISKNYFSTNAGNDPAFYVFRYNPCMTRMLYDIFLAAFSVHSLLRCGCDQSLRVGVETIQL